MASTFLSRHYYITYNRLMTIQENMRKVNLLTPTSFTQTTNRKQKKFIKAKNAQISNVSQINYTLIVAF